MESQLSDVLDFAEALKRKNEELALDDLDADETFALTFSVDVAYDVTAALQEMGYDIGSDSKSILDLMIIIEAVRSLVLRCANKEYPFQKVSDDLFADEDGKEVDHTKLLRDFLEELELS